MNKTAQKSSGVILTYITQIIKIVTGLIYTPIMLSLVGKSEYGIYQVADSVISYLSLINLGVLGAYAKYYTTAQRKRKYSIDEVNGIFLSVLLCMSFICIIVGLVLIRNIEILLGNGFTVDEYALSRTLMLILIVNMAITFPAGLFEHNITVNEKFFVARLIVLLSTLLNPFIALPLLLLGYGSIGLVLTSTLLTISAAITETAYCFIKLNMKFSISKNAFEMLKDIGGFTFFVFLNQIIDLINWNVDKILIGRFMGSSSVAVYSIGGQLRQMFSSFPNAIRSVFQPQMYKMVASNESDNNISSFFCKVGHIQCLILLPILFGFICLGRQFIILWTGNDYIEAYYVALCIMIPIAIPHMQDIGIDLQRAKNKHQTRSVVYAVIALLNIVLTVPFVQIFGITGASIATGISLFLGQGLFMNLFYAYVLHIDIKRFWQQLTLIINTEFLIAIIFFILFQLINIDTWFKLTISVLLYIFVYILTVYIWFLTPNEKNMTDNLLKKISKRSMVK